MRSICNFGYARSKRGGTHFPDVRGLLKYVQYRDDRDDHIPNGGGPDRWVDGGLGDSYPKILARLDQLSPANRFAYCHSIVISPDPQAIEEVDGRFLVRLRGRSVEPRFLAELDDRSPAAGGVLLEMFIGGAAVAVKVQRPGAERIFDRDFARRRGSRETRHGAVRRIE